MHIKAELDPPTPAPFWQGESMSDASRMVPEHIVCVDCGGRCHLLSHPPPDQPFEPDDVVAYRCEDCLDRWDVVVADPADD